MREPPRWRVWTERSLWGIGAVSIALFLLLSLGTRLAEKRERQRFWDEIRAGIGPGARAWAEPESPALTAPPPAAEPSAAAAPAVATPQVSAPPPARMALREPTPSSAEWSEARKRHYDETRAAPLRSKPLAILEVPAAQLEVLVLEGTDEWTLNRAVGWIEGTARPGSAGNIGIAGHRDGFFRGLRRVGEGDSLWLTTPSARKRYRVEQISIVSPDAVEVLAPTTRPTLTLVTCYPFYFVGSAPERLILSAIEVAEEPPPTADASRPPR